MLRRKLLYWLKAEQEKEGMMAYMSRSDNQERIARLRIRNGEESRFWEKLEKIRQPVLLSVW